VSYGDSKDGIEGGNLYARLDCIRAGKMPRANYNLHHWQEVGEQIAASLSTIAANNVADIRRGKDCVITNQSILTNNYVGFLQ
jgi:hypothetical protein